MTYLNRLIYYLHGARDQNEYYVFVTQDNHDKIIAFEDPRFHVIEVRIWNLLHRLLYEQSALPILLRRLNIDIVYAPAEIAPLLAPCPVVLGIQNSNVYYKTEIKWPFADKGKFWILRQLAKISSRKASRIIFVSNTARKDIAVKLRTNPAKTRAILHGVELDRFQKVELAENPTLINQTIGSDKYILCLSGLARHKNIETLIKAYAALDESLQGKYKLVIAGRKTPPYGNELTVLVQQLDLGRRVIFTGEIPHENVPPLYRGASLFVLPSYLETFGIPLVEAMASRVPVIAANASAIPEVVSDAGLLFDPNDPDELRAKMETVLGNPKLREELIRKGLERAKTFSWEKCATETLTVFKEVCEAKRSKL
ncbi:glycosyltransferase family 4 protein [Thermodesulfovibrionales bacterium]|nr:glycosyltransferase family 4 protein [Thermodesulfovibrionales bacterium]